MTCRDRTPVASAGNDALALQRFDAGEATVADRAIEGRFDAVQGASALLVLSFAHQEPLVFSARDELARRLDASCDSWRRWAGSRAYEGPWREPVIRSALARSFHAVPMSAERMGCG